jgi:ubiquitin C-terminal hydrolase
MVEPFGLVNSGVICYLNSFIQALMTCTSITKFFLDEEQRFINEKNTVAIEYTRLLKQALDKNHPQILSALNVFREIVNVLKRKNPNRTFGRGQEDTGEGFTLFLDAIDCPKLYKFFMYKYAVKIWCGGCKKQLSDTSDESCLLEIAHYNPMSSTDNENTKSHILNQHIRQYVSMLTGYTCKYCKGQSCCTTYQLIRAPEIITVMFNKFRKKTNMDFPKKMFFPAITGPPLHYKAVAKIHHSGGMSSGHYWTHALRVINKNYVQSDEKNDSEPITQLLIDEVTETDLPQIATHQSFAYANLNDSAVSNGNMDPALESYVVFYHIV